MENNNFKYTEEEMGVLDHFFNYKYPLRTNKEGVKLYSRFKSLEVSKLAHEIQDGRNYHVKLKEPFSDKIKAQFYKQKYMELDSQYEALYSELRRILNEY